MWPLANSKVSRLPFSDSKGRQTAHTYLESQAGWESRKGSFRPYTPLYQTLRNAFDPTERGRTEIHPLTLPQSGHSWHSHIHQEEKTNPQLSPNTGPGFSAKVPHGRISVPDICKIWKKSLKAVRIRQALSHALQTPCPCSRAYTAFGPAFCTSPASSHINKCQAA